MPASLVTNGARQSDWPASPSSTPLDLPEQFGRYRITTKLGQGGMGSVYLAHDTQLDRDVAVKVPHFTPQDGPEIVERFYREARAAATFDHPNLCPVYDVGQLNGIHYLTMPYIEGKPLSEVIDPGKPILQRQVAAVVRTLALALEEAHCRGVIHRDLKPANIMATKYRELVIMDFGLARRLDRSDARLTRSGALLGTPLYMAPEQISGDHASIGPACDIYSLGVLLYEMLTGRRPFDGPVSLVLGLIMVMEPEPPSKFRPDLDPRLEAICLKAMAKKVKDRYATMADFAAALGDWLARPTSLPGSAPDSSSPNPDRVGPNGQAPGTETLAGQFVVDLVPDSRLVDSPKSLAGRSRKPPPGLILTAAAGTAALALLGIVICRGPAPQDPAKAARKEPARFELRIRAGLTHGRHALHIGPDRVEWDREGQQPDEPVIINELAWDLQKTPVLASDDARRVLPSGIDFQSARIEKNVTNAGKAASKVKRQGDVALETFADHILIRIVKPNAGRTVYDFTISFDTTRAGPGSAAKAVPPPSAADGKSGSPSRGADSTEASGAANNRLVETLKNSIGMTFVRIEPGTFTMGSNGGDPDEKPPHLVRITKPFLLGAHEVTVRQYQAVISVNPSQFKGSDDLPVERVTWFDAVRFCNQFSAREQRNPYYLINGEAVTILGGIGYRLPTEAEWEYACRAGSASRYPFSNDETDLNEYAWFNMNSGKKTHPVGQKRPNRWGLFDMLGNVMEWCQDGYADDYYRKSSPDDPPGPAEVRSRVVRGGAWYSPSWWCTPTDRCGDAPGELLPHNPGFRVAASIPATGPP
jgi:serine/threonine protein kinase/formylglycine-generating enzyme required for sulfatase activity